MRKQQTEPNWKRTSINCLASPLEKYQGLKNKTEKLKSGGVQWGIDLEQKEDTSRKTRVIWIKSGVYLIVLTQTNFFLWWMHHWVKGLNVRTTDIPCQIIVCCGGCAMNCRIFRGTPGVYSVEAVEHPPQWQSKNIFRHSLIYIVNSPMAEHQWYILIFNIN
jgi:hypothetical protein